MRISVVLLTAGLATGQTVLTRMSERQEVRALSLEVPVWNGGLLLGISVNQSPEPVIATFSRSGSRDEIRFSLPDAAIIFARSVAASADGTIATTGTALSNDGSKWGFICVIPANRTANVVVRDDAYQPVAVTITPDAVIWTIGTQMDGKKSLGNVLKRYSASGKLLTSQMVANAGFLPQSAEFRSARDRVGWLLDGYGYVEFALDGHEINRFPLLPDSTKRGSGATIAMTSA